MTPRELEIFLLVARGMPNAEIAAKLVIGETTREDTRHPPADEARGPGPYTSGRARLRSRSGQTGQADLICTQCLRRGW